jgi:hypothetical protein
MKGKSIMASTVTVTTLLGRGVETGREGYGPVIRQRFNTNSETIAANAIVAALKIPEGSIPRRLAVVVKEVASGTCTIKVGNNTGGLGSAGTTDTDLYSVSSNLNLAALGTTIYALDGTPAAAGSGDYIVFEAANAITGAVFDFVLFADIVDPFIADM